MGEGSWAGLDVHAHSVSASALEEATGEFHRLRLGGGSEAVVDWLSSLAAPVRVAYEAGPTGYELARACQRAGIDCLVAAPSKIARPSGDRVKTDRRDAERLMRLLRMGELVAVRVPSEEEEAARDLVRAREDARADLMRARHRVAKLLLRYGYRFEGRGWTRAHEAWLARQRFEGPALGAVWQESQAALLAATARRDALDMMIGEVADAPRWRAVVGRLACLRGVSTLTAFALAVEIGEWGRFSGSGIANYLGLVPSEDSSGERRRRGGITKTGNTHLRRLLVEAAWHQRRPPRPSPELLRRREGQPAQVRHRAEQAARRLHRRWAQLETGRGKHHAVVAVAVARELAGWCWSLAVME